jgi:hypothetical protein
MGLGAYALQTNQDSGGGEGKNEKKTKISHHSQSNKRRPISSFFFLRSPQVHNILCTVTNGVLTEPSRVMDQRPAGQDPQGLVGASAMADAVAVEQQRQGAEEKDPGRVRAPEEAAPSTLPRTQGRVRLGLAGHSLLHGPVRVCLQGTGFLGRFELLKLFLCLFRNFSKIKDIVDFDYTVRVGWWVYEKGEGMEGK